MSNITSPDSQRQAMAGWSVYTRPVSTGREEREMPTGGVVSQSHKGLVHVCVCVCACVCATRQWPVLERPTNWSDHRSPQTGEPSESRGLARRVRRGGHTGSGQEGQQVKLKFKAYKIVNKSYLLIYLDLTAYKDTNLRAVFLLQRFIDLVSSVWTVHGKMSSQLKVLPFAVDGRASTQTRHIHTPLLAWLQEQKGTCHW